MSIIMIPVVGTFQYRGGNGVFPARSYIYFTSRANAIVEAGVVTLPKKFTVKLTPLGLLPAETALPTLAGGIIYDVVESFPGARPAYAIEVMPATVLVDLATIIIP